MDLLNEYLWYLVTITIGTLAIYFTYQVKFVQLRHLGKMARTMFRSREAHEGGISPYQILMTSIGTRVGSGNIIGVCIAIYLGGPGAIFWMWLMSILNMSLSLVESTLAQVYKVDNGDGTYRGGPAYYIERGLNLKWMSALFSILITICFISFTSIQVNVASEFLNDLLDVPKFQTGIALFALFGLVILGSVRSIARVSEFIVPIMSAFYVAMAIFVSIVNIDKIPGIMYSIVAQGLGFQQVVGGVVGGTYAQLFSTMIYGIRRGMFSNEAGLGSIACIAGASDVKHPVVQGYVEAFGVIIDTIIICSATAFIVLSAGILENYSGADSNTVGALLIQEAFNVHFGTWAKYLLTFSICTFSFTSMLGNYYIGETNVRYLINTKPAVSIYQMVTFTVILLSTIATLKLILDFSNTAMGFVAFINLVAIFLLRKTALTVFHDYQDILSGKKADSRFHQSKVLPDLKSNAWKDLD